MTEDVYHTLLREVLHCLSVKLERIERNSLCVCACSKRLPRKSVFATNLEETRHESLLCFSWINHEK